MAKPDLTKVYSSATGQPMKDDGESSLIPALTSLKEATSNATASGAGVTISGIYFDPSANNVIKVRTA
mgnify:CR=1 FL=1